MRRVLISIFVAFAAVFFVTANVRAQDPFGGICDGQRTQSSVCKAEGTTSNPLFGPTGVITRVVQILVIIAGVASVIMIMFGGFKYITSSGDSAKIGSAKDTILYAVIGLVVTILAQTIVSFVLMRL